MAQKFDIESKLQTRIAEFTDDIAAIVREAALEAVRDAFAADGIAIPPSKARSSKAKAAGKAAKKTAKRVSSSGRRIRRTAADLQQIGADFLAHVKSNPGQRLEQIGAALGTETIDLKRPVQLLLQAKQLRTEGERRGTKYFAGKPSAKRKAKKKGRKKAAKR